MKKLWFFARLIGFVAVYAIPRFVDPENDSVAATAWRGCLQLLIFVVGAATIFLSGRNYVFTGPGRCEAVGFAGMVLSGVLAMILTYLNGSPYIGVLLGGFLGLLVVISLLLVIAGGVVGLFRNP